MNGAVAFPLPDGLEDVLGGLDAFLRAEVFPRFERHRDVLEDHVRAYGPTGAYSAEVVELIREIRMASAAAGYYNLAVPESMGGGGLGKVAYFACVEQIFRRCGGTRILGQHTISHWAFGPSAVLEGLTDEAGERVLAKMLTGETSMCFGMSEPDAGSDAAALRSAADALPGGGWRLNGRKIWTSQAPIADWMIVLAITDRERAAQRNGGISVFMVPMRAPGVRVEKVIRMWGEHGGVEAETAFEDVHIEPWQLVGELHQGFRIGMKGVSLGRIFNCGRGVGLGRWAIEMATAYAKERVTFGRPIADYQGVTFPLAESATELLGAHLLAINAATLLDAGLRAEKELSMAKMFAVRVGARAVDRAMQAHGAMGFTNELGLVEAYKTLRNVNVADGTNEILLRTIWKRMAAGDLEL